MNRMRKKIDYILKHNLIIQLLYKKIMSNFFKIMGLFVKIDKEMIIFSGLSRNYNDSPRAIYEYMISKEEYSNFKYVWALEEPDKVDIPKCIKVKVDTWKYFMYTLKAKYWVTCVNIERGLNYKKEDTRYLNTWHGTPLKTIGNSAGRRKDFDFSSIDLFCCAGRYEKDIYIRDFNVLEKNILFSGLPRNDELYNTTSDKVKQIRNKLKIPPDKKVILYAPTWRDSTDRGNSYSIKPPINSKYWKKQLSDKYVVLLRTHAYTNQLMGVEFDEFMQDYSRYSEINDLLIIADILISDYSATIFDYTILERPIICFGYDYEQYKKDRGFYIDLDKELPGGVLKDEKEVLERIKTLDFEFESKKVAEFKKKYLEFGGSATEECVKKLLK
ncbi:MAG: CDP-glycerol glycerophosphotransferase family protein [Zhenhengia sp.]|uniref:CDP-glycerol glycerophosphotransferase family protein n=1 Tax=Zhenhengia sp. TaxID=2944208 RepID=UPI003993D203